jgi:hypothetical protein
MGRMKEMVIDQMNNDAEYIFNEYAMEQGRLYGADAYIDAITPAECPTYELSEHYSDYDFN